MLRAFEKESLNNDFSGQQSLEEENLFYNLILNVTIFYIIF